MKDARFFSKMDMASAYWEVPIREQNREKKVCYTPGEKECWSLISATRKWRTYCRAAKQINLITDHSPLKMLRQQPDPRGKYERWLLELEELPYTII